MKRKLKFHLTAYQDMHKLSIMTTSFVTILVLCFLGANGNSRLTYPEVQKFGNPCPRLDSCGYQRTSGSRELSTIKERNCACDYLCSEYGDCCIDAPGLVMANVSNNYKCYELKQFGGVFMKDSCPSSYEGPDDVRQLCEDTELGDLTDPLGSMPITDSLTGMTYKNYYCSMCNSKTENIVLWTPRLECPTLTLFVKSKNLTDEYVFHNLATDGNNWGLYLDSENGSLFFHDCEVDPVMPLVLESKIRLCKPNLISDCAEDWNDDDARAMCMSYMGAKYVHGGEGYRNVHCALCNHVNVTHLSCQSAELREMFFFRQFENHAFSLLLDINEKGGQHVGLVRVCENGEVFDPFFKKCRSLVCLPGYVKSDKKCILKPIPTAPPDVTDAVSIIPVEATLQEIDYDEYNVSLEVNEHQNIAIPTNLTANLGNLSGVSYNLTAKDNLQEEIGKFQNCLLISLANEDYVMFPNRSIYVPKYEKIYEPTNYHAADGSVLVCTHFTSESDVKFMPMMGYITIVGLGISMLCLVLHLIAFCFVPDLQNLSGKNLVSQCVSLIGGYCCFILSQFDDLNFTSCTAVAFLTYYFFQVSFFWMAIMAYDVWRTLKMATTELRVSNGRQMRRFGVYTFFAWMTPLFMVILVAFAEYTDLFPLSYRPGFARPRCWFKRRRSLLVFFATPLIAVMLANILLYISSARMIVMTTQTTLKQQSQSQRRNFKLYLRLALLMGLTWVVGLIAGYADIEALWYLFVIFNTLQGLFIFVAFSCSSKVFTYLQNKYKKTSKPQEFKSSSNSASTGSGCHTSSTNLQHVRNLSTKLLMGKKNSASPTNSTNPGATPKGNTGF